MSKQSLSEALIQKDRDAGLTRADKLQRTRRGTLITAATASAAAALIVSAASKSGEHPAPVSDTTITCELPVHTGDTVSGFAIKFKDIVRDIKIYHNGKAEANPVYDMQPGDIAAAKIGALACQEIGGDIGDPTRPNVIIE